MSSARKLFHPASINLHVEDPDEREVKTIPQLIEFNARQNPDHVFCVQARKQQDSIPVSHLQLKQAILKCSGWLIANVEKLTLPYADTDGNICRGPPVALAMNSDIGLLVHLLSLLSLGVPVLLLSARLNPSAMKHLVLETSAEAIIGAPNRRTTVQEARIPLELQLRMVFLKTVKMAVLTPMPTRRYQCYLPKTSEPPSMCKNPSKNFSALKRTTQT